MLYHVDLYTKKKMKFFPSFISEIIHMDSRLLAASKMMDRSEVFVWAHGRLTNFRLIEKKDGDWKRVLFEVMTDGGSVSFLSSDLSLKDQDMVAIGDMVTCYGTEGYYIKDGRIARSCNLIEVFLDKKSDAPNAVTTKISATKKLNVLQLQQLFGTISGAARRQTRRLEEEFPEDSDDDEILGEPVESNAGEEEPADDGDAEGVTEKPRKRKKKNRREDH
jgi:hypothetical protein